MHAHVLSFRWVMAVSKYLLYDGRFFAYTGAMEISTQINYNGYRANYKITTLNSIFYHAELTEFSGVDTEIPPSRINFIKINERPIASADVIHVVENLLKEMKSKDLMLH